LHFSNELYFLRLSQLEILSYATQVEPQDPVGQAAAPASVTALLKPFPQLVSPNNFSLNGDFLFC